MTWYREGALSGKVCCLALDANATSWEGEMRRGSITYTHVMIHRTPFCVRSNIVVRRMLPSKRKDIYHEIMATPRPPLRARASRENFRSLPPAVADEDSVPSPKPTRLFSSESPKPSTREFTLSHSSMRSVAGRRRKSSPSPEPDSVQQGRLEMIIGSGGGE